MFAVLSGQLNENQTFDMVKVTTNDPSPYYLRFGTADQLSTQGFSNRAPSAGAPVTSGIPDSHLNLPGVTQQTYSAQVTIENFDMGLAPVYGLLSKTGGGLDGSWLYDRNGQLVYSTRTSVKGKRYAFEFAATSYSKQVLESSPALDPNDPNRQYTQVPKVDAVQQQVAKLTRGKATPYDTVLALYDFFSTANGFSYALTTANGTSGSDIVDFLTHKKGYCEQYAAALAWMVRAAGIPARVAFGFTRGSNKDGNTYTLTNNNLHAWTEVYFKNIGWVPFDATPTSGISGSVSPAWAPDRDHQDAVTPTPGASGSNSGTTGGASSSASGGPHDVDNSGDLNFGTIKKPAPTWPWWLFGSGMALLVMLCVPAVGRTVMRRRRQIGRLTSSGARATPVAPDGEPPLDSPGQLRVVSGTGAEAARRDAHASWDELLDTLVDYRVPVHEAETPRVTALRVTRALKLPPPAAESLALLGRTEEWARYARQPVTDPGLGPALRAVRKSIRGTVSRRTRLRAALFPPSVMARWRTGSATAISAVVARSGRIRDGVLTALPPRRTRPARTR
jgi:transglutaminase-like putative cysteine protease